MVARKVLPNYTMLWLKMVARKMLPNYTMLPWILERAIFLWLADVFEQVAVFAEQVQPL